jgi:4-hydroxy-tetrahydrodipicolinate synthase
MIPNDVGPNDISRSARTLRDPRFTGAFTAIITPFTADGARIDYARLEQQIDRQKSGGVTGVVVCGTTGESPTLTEGEYRELVERTIALCKDRGLLTIVGTGSNSTAHAVHLHKQAASAGADGSLSVNPYYNKPTQEGLYRHFATVADSADLPVMLYNIPGRTGVALTPETVERIAGHARIVANKEATGATDSASEIVQRCPDIALLSGDDSMTLPFGSVGGVGVVSVISNIVPDRMSLPGHVPGDESDPGQGRPGDDGCRYRRVAPAHDPRDRLHTRGAQAGAHRAVAPLERASAPRSPQTSSGRPFPARTPGAPEHSNPASARDSSGTP